MSDREHDDLIDLLHEADRALVEDTPEAKEELVTLVRRLCREYHVVRAVPRGPAPEPKPHLTIEKIHELVAFARTNKIPIHVSSDMCPEEVILYAAAAQMLKALQHVAEYLEEVAEDYDAGCKPPGLICAESYVREAIKAASLDPNPLSPLN